jgi:hypothetical protein
MAATRLSTLRAHLVNQIKKQAAAATMPVICIESSSEDSVQWNDGSSRWKPKSSESKMTAAKRSKRRKSRQNKKATKEGRTLQCQCMQLTVQTHLAFLRRVWSLWYEESLARSIATNRDGTLHDINIIRASICRSSLVVLQSKNVSIMLKQYQTLDLMPELRLNCTFGSLHPRLVGSKTLLTFDNLSKFILDACNETFCGDDDQFVCLYADKGFANEYGGEGYTRVKIQVAGGS